MRALVLAAELNGYAAALDPDLVSPRIRSVLSQCERLDNPPAPPQIPPHAGTRG